MNAKFISLMLVMMLAKGASATLLNVTFSDTDGTAVSSSFGGMAGQEGVWNEIVATGETPLVDLSGGSTAATINAYGVHWMGNGSGGTDLAKSTFYNMSGDPWTIDFSGLDNGSYYVYIYAASHSAIPTMDYIVNGASMSSLEGSSAAFEEYVEGVDWDWLQVEITDGTLSLAATVATTYNGVAGIQISDSLPIPEPATFAFVGVFGIGALAVRRIFMM